MRVLIYAHYQPPHPSASATRMMSLAKHLRSCGHTVEFLTSQPGPAVADGFNVIRAKGRRGLAVALFEGPREVIFVSSPPATPAAEVAFMARVLGYRVMVDIRDPYIIEAIKNAEVSPGLKTKIKGFLEWSLPRSAHRMSFVSEYLRSEFEVFSEYTDAHTVIAPNGADLDVFQYSQERRSQARDSLQLTSEPLFCYAGILGGKDLDKAVSALAPALRRGAKLLIVGIVDQYSAPLKASLLEQVAALGVPGQLIWRENLQVPELAQLLTGVDVGINPLPSHRSYCLPVKTYEYMACGAFNLAHGGEDSAMLRQLDPRAGVGSTSWADFGEKALDLVQNIERLREQAPARVVLAQGFGRKGSNEILCSALEQLRAA